MTIKDEWKSIFTLHRLLTFISLLIFPIFVFADCTSAECVAKNYKGECTAAGFACPPWTGMHGFLTLSGGYAYAHVGSSPTIKADDIEYFYQADRSIQNQPYGGALVGAEFRYEGGLALQIGLSYYENAPFKAQGNVSIDSKGNSDDHNYNYQILTRQALVEIKFLGNFGQPFYHPYFTLGVGEAFNSTYDYNTKTTDTPLFDGKRNNSFSYSAGLGVDADVYRFTRLGIGYRYANFGSANLGRGHVDDVETKELKTHLHTEAWVVQLTIVV
jgi:opacity protein-like surface antigen